MTTLRIGSLTAGVPVRGAALCVCFAVAACGGKKEGPGRRADAPKLLEQGKASFERGDLDDALAKYRKAVKARPDWAKAQNLLGMALRYKYYETGDSSYREEEIAAFRRAVKLQPGGVVARVNLATSLWQAGRFEEAGGHYRKVLEKQPDHPDARAMKRRVATASKSPQPAQTQR